MQDLKSRMRQALERMELDAVLAISMENVYYLTGAWITTQKAIPDRLAVVVWPRVGEPQFIVCSIEESLARRDSRIQKIHGYVEFEVSPVEKLAEIIRSLGLERARIGFERKYLVAHYYEELQKHLPNVRWVGGDRVFDEVRMIKSDEEIGLLSRAAQCTDSVIWDAFQMVRAGRTEKEIGDWMQMQLLARGADEGIFLVLGAGDSAGLAHPAPRARKLLSGEVMRVDFGGLFGGYFSDLARSMVVGAATAVQRDDYARLWAVQNETIAAIRPGVRACDIYRLCAERARAYGLAFDMPHIGHGLGIGLHEYPMISPRHTEPLAENMVIAIEPTCRNSDGSVFHIEDLIVVRAGGAQIVSRAGQWDKLFEGT